MDEAVRDRLKGMFFGLAVGDALGTTLEFKDRVGPYKVSTCDIKLVDLRVAQMQCHRGV